MAKIDILDSYYTNLHTAIIRKDKISLTEALELAKFD